MATKNSQLRYDCDMKNLAEIRRDNLIAMINEYRDTVLKGVQRGAMTSFARYLDMNPVQVSQLKNGTAPIGNPLARQIEKKAGKPPLWMDDEHHLVDMGDPGQVDFFDVAMTLYRHSPENAKDALLKAMRDIVEKQNKSK